MSVNAANGRERQLGQATSTAGADESALRLYQIYRQRKGKTPFGEMRFVEIEADNLENEVFNYAIWCSSTPIPRFFDDNLQPRRASDGPVKLLLKTTLSKYIGKIIVLIRRKFPTHPDFAGLKPQEVPEWWTQLRPQFEKECDRFLLNIGSEFTFGEMTVRPLYSDNEFVGYSAHGEVPINDYISVIDLNTILRNQMKEAKLSCDREGKLQQRAWLAILFSAVGRGGEVKFVDIADWMWHPRFEVVDIGWTELKMREKYAMPMVPHKRQYLADFYHAIGSFWAVEGGLFQAGDDQHAIESYLFPDLHSLNDSGVLKKITAVIRENLPDGCPQDITDSYSAKLLQRGSITELMMHRALNGMDVCGRSGHSTGTTLDSYADKTFIVRGLRGARGLGHYNDVDAITKVPRLECLGAHTAGAVKELLDKLFVVSVAAFQQSGSLHVVLRTCAATLIMRHREVTRDFTPANAVATKLQNAAREAGISDACYPGESPECVLDRWSDLVSKDFDARNPEIAEATPDMVSMATVMNQQTKLLIEMQADMQVLRHERDADRQSMASQQQRISYLENDRTLLREELNRANGKLELLKTLPSARTRPREDEEKDDDSNKSPRLALPAPAPNHSDAAALSALAPQPLAATATAQATMTAQATTTAQATATTQATATAQVAVAAQAVTVQAMTAQPNRRLMYGSEAREVAETGSNKKMFFAMILEKFYGQGLLKGAFWKNVSPPAKFAEKQLLKNTLELCEAVMDEEETRALKNDGLSNHDLKQHAKTLRQSACNECGSMKAAIQTLRSFLTERGTGVSRKSQHIWQLGNVSVSTRSIWQLHPATQSIITQKC